MTFMKEIIKIGKTKEKNSIGVKVNDGKTNKTEPRNGTSLNLK